MTWLKKNLVFTFILLLLTAVLAVEIFYVLGRRANAAEAEEQFYAKVEEYQRLTGRTILPHDRNVALSQREIELKTERAQEIRQVLRGNEELRAKFASPPASRADAFFDIATFVENYRVKAVGAGIEIPSNEYFGFGAYSTSGPAQDRIAEVYRQRVIVAHVLDRLIDSRPLSLVAIVREGQSRAAGPGRPDGGGGSFQLPSAQSLATSNVAETLAFQVVFTGRTHTLRSFMNALAEFDMPLVVRHVDVSTTGVQTSEPRAGAEPRRGRGRAADPGETRSPAEEDEPQQEENILIIPETTATFTVSLEYLDVLPIQSNSGS